MAAAIRSRPVSFTAADGAVLHGTVAGAGPRGVVLAHGARYDQTSWQPYASELAAAGFRTLAFDFRGWGQSRPGSGGGRALAADVLAAAQFLRAAGCPEVAAVGGSMGGAAVLGALATAPAGLLAGVVLLSPAGAPATAPLRGPKLFVWSEAETLAGRVAAIYEQAEEPKQCLVLPGTAHGQEILAGDHASRVKAAIAEFLRTCR